MSKSLLLLCPEGLSTTIPPDSVRQEVQEWKKSMRLGQDDGETSSMLPRLSATRRSTCTRSPREKGRQAQRTPASLSRGLSGPRLRGDSHLPHIWIAALCRMGRAHRTSSCHPQIGHKGNRSGQPAATGSHGPEDGISGGQGTE
jgi:hypothetical protein